MKKVSGYLAMLKKHSIQYACNEMGYDMAADFFKYRSFDSLVECDAKATKFSKHSRDIIPGYRLADNWFKVLFAQLLLEAAAELGRLGEEKEKFKIICESIGWDYETSVNPEVDNLSKWYDFKFDKGGQQTGTVKLVVIPYDEFPIGSIVKSKTAKFKVTSILSGVYTIVSEKGRVFKKTKKEMEKYEIDNSKNDSWSIGNSREGS